MVSKIYIINGPNLNLLGKREPEIYGTKSFDFYFEELKAKYPHVILEYLQTNHEGVIIDYLHQHGFDANAGIILNAGGYSHTSVALRDAVASIETQVVEVHISDIDKREEFRHHSFLTEVCAAHFIGRGLPGYEMAIEFLLNR